MFSRSGYGIIFIVPCEVYKEWGTDAQYFSTMEQVLPGEEEQFFILLLLLY